MKIFWILLLIGSTAAEALERGGGLRQLYKRWESRRVRWQGAGAKKEREARKEKEKERLEEELLGLGRVNVEGGEVVTAELVDKESIDDVEREERELSRTELPAVTVTYIISAADQRTVVAKLTSEEEKKNFFADRKKETTRESDDGESISTDLSSLLTTAITTPSTTVSTPTASSSVKLTEKVSDVTTSASRLPKELLSSRPIVDLAGATRRRERRRGGSQRLLGTRRSKVKDGKQGEGTSTEGRRSRRFPKKRPTVGPVVVGAANLPTRVHKKMDLLRDLGSDKKQEVVVGKMLNNFHEIESDVKLDIKPDVEDTLRQENKTTAVEVVKKDNDAEKDKQPVLLIKKNATKEEVVMKKHEEPKLLLGMTQNAPKLDLGTKQTKIVQITSALKKEMKRKPEPRTRSILIKKVLTSSQIPEKSLTTKRPSELVEKLPKPLKVVERKPSIQNLPQRRPKLFEIPEDLSTKPGNTNSNPLSRSLTKKLTGQPQTPLGLVERHPVPDKMTKISTPRSKSSNTKSLFEGPKNWPKDPNKEATFPKHAKIALTDIERSPARQRPRPSSESGWRQRQPKLLRTTTESPEAWLDRFYSKSIRTVPRKMISSVKLLTSVEDGGLKEVQSSKEEETKSNSSSSQSERQALRQLLALVGSEEATIEATMATGSPGLQIKTAPTKTTTTNARAITTSIPKRKPPKANIQESDNTFLQLMNDKSQIKNDDVTHNKSGDGDAKLKPKDFLLKMMLLSQDDSSITTSNLVSLPQSKTKDETMGEEEKMEEVEAAWQAVSSLTTIFDTGNNNNNNKAAEENVFSVIENNVNNENRFGDNLQLIFVQQAEDDDPRKPLPTNHNVQHGQEKAEPELRTQEKPEEINLDFSHQDQFSQQNHHHLGHPADHLDLVRSEFKPAISTSEYGSQWLPVFSPSHRVL